MLNSIFTTEWGVLLTVTAILLAAAELGFRLGLRLHRSKDEARRTQISGVQGAMLGLLGLLLGFTYAMGINRYDAHRTLVLKEADAIGTTWLRAGLLPKAQRAPVEDLLRRYVDLLLHYTALVGDPAKMEEGVRNTREIENQLWQHAKTAAEDAPTGPTVLFITALNDMINTGAERLDAFRNQIPTGIWVLLLIVAGSGCFTTSYGSGAQGARSLFTNVFLPMLITVVIVLIFDLTHSLQGVIGVSQQPLIELRNSMQSEPKPYPHDFRVRSARIFSYRDVNAKYWNPTILQTKR